MSSMKPFLEDLNLLVLPIVAALGVFLREVVAWLRGNKSEDAQALRTDMEVGKALRDELLAEIARQDSKIDAADAECQRRLDRMEARLKVVQTEADTARQEAHDLREALTAAEKLIATLKKQVAHLSQFARSQGDTK